MPADSSSDERARVGVIGTGWWSTAAHLPSLASYERADLVALADRDPAKLERAVCRFGSANTYSNHDQMLAEEGLDGVVVAVPHAAHFPVVRDCLAAGVHVLVEKPLALTSADAWLLVHQADLVERHLMVGYTYQFTSHAQAARDVVRAGELGKVTVVQVEYMVEMRSLFAGSGENEADLDGEMPGTDTYTHPAVAGGGLLQTAVTHVVAMALWTTGLRATRVTALMDNLEAAVDCVASAVVELGDTAVGTLTSTAIVQPGQTPSVRVTYHGTRGTMVHDLVAGRITVYSGDGPTRQSPELAAELRVPKELPARRFVDLVLDGGENPAPGEAAARTAELVEAAYRSNELRRTVKVPVTAPRGFADGAVVPPDYNWASLAVKVP